MKKYAKVILPIAIPKPYSYAIPEILQDQVSFGKRVEVQFGSRKLYAGLVMEISGDLEKGLVAKPKEILSVIDEEPIINRHQLDLWKWMSSYYLCSLGEVMNASLPGYLKMTSETTILLHPDYEQSADDLSDKEYLIVEALTIQNELSIEEAEKILQQKKVYPLIYALIQRGILLIKENLKQKYKPKTISFIHVLPPYDLDILAALELCKRSEKQTRALMAIHQLRRSEEPMARKEIERLAEVKSTDIKALAKKGIIELVDLPVSRIETYGNVGEAGKQFPLLPQQIKAIEDIRSAWSTQLVTLLHGVTGSGKTRIYTEFINEIVDQGSQVLYMLPEIALTTHVVQRLSELFGEHIVVYHSKMTNQERVEVWHAVKGGKPFILGARSSLFLPFADLQLIIVDEEHDPSFKQQDPAPRYHARDTAIFMATLYSAKVLLGSATPSFETYFNVRSGKYGLAEMKERVQGLPLPEMHLVNIKAATELKQMHDEFSSVLLNAIQETVNNNEQVILFQNRRGFSPFLRCPVCEWRELCINCDVSLTYHKFSKKMVCHFCGYNKQLARSCPACGNPNLSLQGFGTEKIEEQLKILLPELRVKRMDLDSVRSRHSFEKILDDFEAGEFDVLVGTQMVTKGLDFGTVGIVGLMLADTLFYFPDFRADERAYQLITQVSGRAGRKNKQGNVYIQTYQPTHPILLDVKANHYLHFYHNKIAERKQFRYPPFYRLIYLELKHKKAPVVKEAAEYLAVLLKTRIGKRLDGPTEPGISRIRSYYLRKIQIRMEKNPGVIIEIKKWISECVNKMQDHKGFSNVRVNIDVDPY